MKTRTNDVAPLTTARNIKLNELVVMKNGTTVRIVRIKAGDVWFQNANVQVVDGVPGWMLGCDIVTIARFSALVAA